MMDYDKRSHIHWTYQYMSLQAGDSNVQPASIFVVEIAVDVMSVRHMVGYDIEVIYTGMQIGQGSKCLSSRKRQSQES